MSELTTLKETVYSDVVTVVGNYVTSPDDHVIREDDDEPDQPPMVALNGQTRSRRGVNSKAGLNDILVEEVTHNPFDVRYARERSFNVDVTISDTDGDRADNILEGIENAFTYNDRFRSPSTFVSTIPIDEIRVEDTSPTDRGQRVGHSLAIEIDFGRTFWYSDVDDPPTEVTEVVQLYDNGNTVTTDSSGSTYST